MVRAAGIQQTRGFQRVMHFGQQPQRLVASLLPDFQKGTTRNQVMGLGICLQAAAVKPDCFQSSPVAAGYEFIQHSVCDLSLRKTNPNPYTHCRLVQMLKQGLKEWQTAGRGSKQGQKFSFCCSPIAEAWPCAHPCPEHADHILSWHVPSQSCLSSDQKQMQREGT